MPDLLAPAPHRRVRLARRAGILAAALLLTLTACGGDEEDTGSAATPTTAAEETTEAPVTGAAPTEGTGTANQPTTLTATAVDFAFEVAQTEFPAGPVTIELTNEGQGNHDLTIEDADGNEVAKTDVLQPGGTGSVEVNLQPGDYVFYCSVGNHREMGMEVPVTVGP